MLLLRLIKRALLSPYYSRRFFDGFVFQFHHPSGKNGLSKPGYSPAEVIAIQLHGLQYNDTPQTDAGVNQTWEFAHPRNRAMTGWLSRFATMLKGPTMA